ncbi:hypothetical protein C8Q70DRAFT_1044986 [Cubamyces menziesii]|nr:hypothetical protein C8Q70DRAFT_1044986 [Cubamyces menziesii]
MSTPPWDIYAEQLEPLGYGYPLWTPDPAPGAAQVDIGDVGLIKDGEFIALFNIFRGEDEGQPRGCVPIGHVPLDISKVEVVGPRDKISQSPLYSRSIRVTNASGGASISTIEFECTEDAGALLVLGPKRIIDYMHANLDRWLEFANDRLGIGLKENQIILVSGTTKTNVWAVAAFAGKRRSKSGSIAGNLGSVGAVDFSLAIYDAQLSTSHHRAGPSARMPVIHADRPEATPDNEYDQCIFIHYYKAKRKRRFIPFFMQAGGGPHELPNSTTESSSSLDGASLDWEVFEQSPEHRTARQTKDLVDHTLDYILEVGYWPRILAVAYSEVVTEFSRRHIRYRVRHGFSSNFS